MHFTKKLPDFTEKTFVAELSGKKCATLRSFYGQVAKALHFPDYFGKNLDALDECLADLSWIEQKEVALTVREAALFLKKENPAKREAVLDIFKNLAEAPGEKPFRVFFVE